MGPLYPSDLVRSSKLLLQTPTLGLSFQPSVLINVHLWGLNTRIGWR